MKAQQALARAYFVGCDDRINREIKDANDISGRHIMSQSPLNLQDDVTSLSDFVDKKGNLLSDSDLQAANDDIEAGEECLKNYVY